MLDLAGLKPEPDAAARQLKANWNRVKGRNEASRHKAVDEKEACAMLNALADPGDGVFEWIRSGGGAIETALLDRMLIDYALVAELPRAAAA
ncbi:hypothetical protein ACNHKD_09340 [Methylocystis sp. JAN1]|uniref:hypothetical protein n=1 Tax=Methylocystis sp. JAN1 TaxID=3397211 RepID=UPI003FA2C477